MDARDRSAPPSAPMRALSGPSWCWCVTEPAKAAARSRCPSLSVSGCAASGEPIGVVGGKLPSDGRGTLVRVVSLPSWRTRSGTERSLTLGRGSARRLSTFLNRASAAAACPPGGATGSASPGGAEWTACAGAEGWAETRPVPDKTKQTTSNRSAIPGVPGLTLRSRPPVSHPRPAAVPRALPVRPTTPSKPAPRPPGLVGIPVPGPVR